jgi:SAM-dependent methyltransferase
MSGLKYDYAFDPDAENQTAASIARYALTGGLTVLDIGSGPGIVSRYLAAEHGRSVTCLDNDKTALESLSGTGIEAVYADLESTDWHRSLHGRTYDVVIVADVLEHMRDPGQLLDAVLGNGLLAEDGIVVVSVPNASHEAVVAELLLGDFRYTTTGILDATHLRWFTLPTLSRLLEGSGLLVDGVERTTRIIENTPSADRALQVPSELRREIKQLNPDADTYQYVVRARRNSATVQLTQLREQLDAQRRETLTATSELRRAQLLVEEQRAELDRLAREGAEELASLRTALDRARRRVRKLLKRTDALTGRVQTVRRRKAGVDGELAQARKQIAALEGELDFYRGSRPIRFTSRVVRAVRRDRA